MHRYLSPVPWLLLLLFCAYVGWGFVKWVRSIEATTSESGSASSVGHTVKLAFLHWVVGTAASVLIGFLPEAFLSRYYFDTRIEAFSPAIAGTAFILGIGFSGRFKNGRGAAWVWVFGLLWLAIGIDGLQASWNPAWSTQRSSWQYAMVNLFGPTSACSASECLSELAYTMPFAVSVAYSIGAFFNRFLRTSPKS